MLNGIAVIVDKTILETGQRIASNLKVYYPDMNVRAMEYSPDLAGTLDGELVLLEGFSDKDDILFNALIARRIPTLILSRDLNISDARKYKKAGAIDFMHFANSNIWIYKDSIDDVLQRYN